MIHTYHVDPSVFFRRGVSEVLEGELGVRATGGAADPNEAWDTIDWDGTGRPDLVITALSFQGGSGLGFIRDLAERISDVGILGLAQYDEKLYAERVLRAGGHGYLRKSASEGELLDAVRATSAGELFVSEAYGDELIRAFAAREGRRSEFGLLTDKEMEVLRLIAGGRTTDQIAVALYVSPKTVRTYRRRMRDKLNCEDAHQLTRAALLLFGNGHSTRLRPPRDPEA